MQSAAQKQPYDLFERLDVVMSNKITAMLDEQRKQTCPLDERK